LILFFITLTFANAEDVVYQEDILSNGDHVLGGLLKDYQDTLQGSEAEKYLKKFIHTTTQSRTREEVEAVRDYNYEADIVLEEETDTSFGNLIAEQFGESDRFE